MHPNQELEEGLLLLLQQQVEVVVPMMACQQKRRGVTMMGERGRARLVLCFGRGRTSAGDGKCGGFGFGVERDRQSGCGNGLWVEEAAEDLT
jgi:hypothetical protein